MIRARAIGVLPDESSTTDIPGTTIKVDNDYTPEIDVTYFFSDHIAAELIAATSEHDIETEGAANLDLGKVWALPSTLTLQYHFNPFGIFRPYMGAGLGYMIWYDEGGYGPGVNSVSYENDKIYALQAGADIAVDNHWSLNVDVKKMFHNIDAKVNQSIGADIDLDPWVVGVGAGYRF